MCEDGSDGVGVLAHTMPEVSTAQEGGVLCQR